MRNKEVRLMLFPAKEFYGRLRDLESNCKVARANNPKLSTQVRYGTKDLILMVKNKDETRYSQRDILTYGYVQDINLQKRNRNRDDLVSPPKGRNNLTQYTNSRCDEISKNVTKRKVTSPGQSPSYKKTKSIADELEEIDPFIPEYLKRVSNPLVAPSDHVTSPK